MEWVDTAHTAVWLIVGLQLRVAVVFLLSCRALWLWRLRQRRRLGLLAPSTLHSLAGWSLDAVSAVFLAVVVVLVQAAPTPTLGCAWAAAELAFFLWYSKRLNYLDAIGQSFSDSWSSSVLAQGVGLFQRLLDEREGALSLLQRYPHHIQDWFMGHSHGEVSIGVGNVAELLDHLLMQGQAKKALQSRDSVSSSESEEDMPEHASEGLLHSLAASLWSHLGLDSHEPQQDPAGAQTQGVQYTPGVTPISPADQPLMACYRPLLFYVLMEAIAGWTHVTLTLRQGFTRAASTPTATYYVKQGRKPNRAPIVFLHGIGVGIAPYVAFLTRMAERTGRTIIAVQYKHVSMRMTHHVPSAKQVAANVLEFLNSHGHTSFSVVAHSYGTLVASSLVKSDPERITSLTLLDPVCFAMFLPHLLRNSLFFHVNNKPAAGAEQSEMDRRPVGRVRSWVKNPLKGVVVRDVHVAAALSRNNHWADVNLWPTDLPAHAPTNVFLSANDHLVPIQEVVDMLSSSVAADKGVKVHVQPNKGHGAFVLDPEMQDSIIVSLGGMSEAAYNQRLQSKQAFHRRSLDAMTDVATGLQSLVASLQDAAVGEVGEESDAALRMLAPGLVRSRSRWAPRTRVVVSSWARANVASLAVDCTCTDAACSGCQSPLVDPEYDPLVSPALSPVPTPMLRRVGSAAWTNGSRAVASGGPWLRRAGGAAAAAPVGGWRRPVLTRFRPLQRLSPVSLLQVCSRMLGPRRVVASATDPSGSRVAPVAPVRAFFRRAAWAVPASPRTPCH